ncbi:thiamine pyrophosphate-dependent enzyme [Pseudalkalibacillus sp. A8]|uniref:thiamine pyrophosphate-dependent enzyme n=1 Tax=Pseudalkalibacillus sp. A8 TaxID=3382641 RepID=UPI0038B52E0F
MAKLTAAQAIVEVLIQENVEKAFCVPGESYLSVMDALNDQDQISLISGRHEGGVSFMTEGYAKASGKVGVCFATRGPGATNLSIGLHTAKQDSTPIVAFIGQVERNYQEREAFQEVNLEQYFRHLVKWSVEIRDASRTDELVSRAFHVARSGRPGPVVVSLPQDVLDETAEFSFHCSRIYSDPRPNRDAVAQVKDMMTSANQPVIIAGGGICTSKASGRLADLADKLQAPVMTAFRRFDAFPNDDRHYAGSLGLGTPGYLLDCIKESDVVLAIGTRFSQITTQDYTLMNPSSKLIHVDISPHELNKVYKPHTGIVSDAKQFIEDLFAITEAPALDRKKQERVKFYREEYVKFREIPTLKDDEYVDLAGAIKDLKDVLPEDTIITNDAGNFFGWLAKYYSFIHEGTYVGPTSGAMGYGMPAAIGAKLARPDKQVVCLSGDGGFMMTMQELETAIRYNIPVIAVVANNNMYGTIRMHQEIQFPNRVIGTDLTNPDFAEMAKVMGCHGERVESNDDFTAALKRALKSGKPSVIEVRTDPQQISVRRTIDELRGVVKSG